MLHLTLRRYVPLILPIALSLPLVLAQAQKMDSTSANPYIGRWDLTLNAPDKEYPSWLELTEKDGRLSANFVGRWGNARPLVKAELSNGKLIFVSPKEEEDSNRDLSFEGTLSGDVLSGSVNAPDGKSSWSWTGKRAP